MSEPRVSCTACGRTWNSATMEEGLRSVGRCPRCGGELRFASPAPAGEGPAPAAERPGRDVPPSQVLGVPRR